MSVFSLRGRIRRGTYWGGLLIASILSLMIWGAINLALPSILPPPPQQLTGFQNGLFVGAPPASLVMTGWLFASVHVRRLHDRNKSGWLALAAFIPFIGGLWLLFECGLLPTMIGTNRYGSYPLSEKPAERKAALIEMERALLQGEAAQLRGGKVPSTLLDFADLVATRNRLYDEMKASGEVVENASGSMSFTI